MACSGVRNLPLSHRVWLGGVKSPECAPGQKTCRPSLLRPSLWPASLRPVSLMSAGQDAASLHMSQDALSSPVTVGGAVGDALPRLLPGVFFRCSARCP